MTTFDEVWSAIFSAKTVYWKTEGYRVHPVEVHRGNKPEEQRHGLALRVTYTENFFGGFLQESEIPHLFTDEAPL